MNRRSLFAQMKYGTSIILLVLCVVVRGSSFANAADSTTTRDVPALALVPNDALLVVVVPRLADLDAKPAALGAPLKLPVPGLLAIAKGMLGIKEGINDEGSAVIALVGNVKGEAEEMGGVGFVSVSDFQKLIGQFAPEDKGNGISLINVPGVDRGLLVAQKNDQAVFVRDSAGQRKLLEQILQAPPHIPESIAPLKDWIVQQNASYIITNNGFKTFIPKAREHLKAGVVAAEGQSGAESVRSVMEMYDQLLTSIEKEVAQFGFGLRIDSDATVRMTSRARFVTGGNWAKASGNVLALEHPPLTGLSAGPFFMAYDMSIGGSVGEAFTDFTLSMMKKGLAVQGDKKISDDDWKKLSESMKKGMQGKRSTAFTIAVPQAGQSLFSAMSGVVRVADTKEFMQTYEVQIAASNELFKSITTGTPTQYEVKKWEVDGTPALEMTADLSEIIKKLRNQQPAGAPGQAGVLDMMFGSGDKMRTYLAPADRHTIVMAWDSLDNLKKAIVAAKSPKSLATDEGVKSTTAMMLKDAQWIGFLSPAGTISFVKMTMQAAAPQLPFRLPEFPKTPPIGFAAHASSEGIDAEMVMPAAVLEGIGAYVQQVQQMFRGPQN